MKLTPLASLRTAAAAWTHYRALCTEARWDAARIRRAQTRLLAGSLRYAAEQVPYYRQTFKRSGFSAAELARRGLSAVPFTTKQDIRGAGAEDFLSDRTTGGRVWSAQSTGSSGAPMRFYRDAATEAWQKAYWYYSLSAVGVGPKDRLCQVLSERPEAPSRPGLLASLGLRRSVLVPLKQSPERILEAVRQDRSTVLYSFPSVFLRLARHIQERGGRAGLRMLIAHGEMMPEDQRKVIEKAFDAPVYHTYGSTEFPRVGFECRRQRGYHLIPDAAWIEVVRPDGSACAEGEEGEIVLTDLRNRCMPLLRYRIGDRGVLAEAPCGCGNPFPMLASVTGRMDDELVLPSGTRISPRAINCMEIAGILEYRITQKSPELFEVQVVPAAGYGPSTVSGIEKEIRSGCQGERVRVEVTAVEALPLSATGKLQAVVREF